jgi:TonB family protein
VGSLAPIIAIVAVVVLAAAGYFVMQNSSMFVGARDAQNYSVAPYRPQGEVIAARERVEARAAPDAAAPIVVVFGQGATINVTGRVSRGLGNDWYAISWNNRTAFVRQSDAISGSGAPPTPDVRQPAPEEEKEKPPTPEEDEFPNVEDEVVEAPPTSSGQLDMSDVDWAREPNARDFARYYPSEALDHRRSGRVVLDCVIRGSGHLDCSVAQESPGGEGFGDAALSISRQVRVRSRLLDGSPAEGRHLRLPLAFRAH